MFPFDYFKKKREADKKAKEQAKRAFEAHLQQKRRLNATLFSQSPRPRTLYESSPARKYDSAADITEIMNPANPLSPLFYPAPTPAYEQEPPRECPAPSYEPDISTRYDSCSSSSSYDSGSPSSYDSGSSSSDSSSYSSGD